MSRHTRESTRNAGGFLLASLLVTVLLITLVGIATAQLATANYRLSSDEFYRMNAQFSADAGMDQAIEELNADHDWTGSGGEVTLLQDTGKKLTFSSIVTGDADPLKKFITVTGRTYSPANSAEPSAERRYQIELRGVTGGVGGSFSVVTGVGGLVMQNNAKIVGGEVYVNGRIDMSNSAQIGLSSSPVNVKAAHQSCPNPPNATYPRACASGENGQPIRIIDSARIYGEVRATNQTNGARMSNPGLTAGAVEPADLPTHDRTALKNAVTTTRSGSAASCSSGTRTWPANIKITGDVTISNSCRVTVQGDVWITGKLTVENSSELIVQNGLTASPVIMIDGSDGLIAKNSSVLKSNTNVTPVGFRIITYWSSASCSPDCADVTGTTLANSRNTDTILLSNGSAGPNTEFYARWSAVNVENGGNIGALVGQTVKLSNSSTVTFGTTVTSFSNSEIAAWVVESYKRLY